jgi:hypothetical protein
MKIEQNSFIIGDLTNASPGNTKGYVDIARALSALNGKAICQTKRRDGKYRPLTYLVRVRALIGDCGIQTLNNGYPTRNAVVLAGASRDAMLKSAGVSRSNLETYQKELRILMEDDMDRTNTWLPNASTPGVTTDDIGSGNAALDEAYGINLTYDYTSLVWDDPASAGTDVSKTMCALGNALVDGDSVPLIYNWSKWRHNLTPSAAADDIEDNAFSYAMQQSSTADKIIDIVEDEADEKPYQLSDFTTRMMYDIVGTSVGNPTSKVISVPLGLMKMTTGQQGGTFEIEVVGVTEL